jgi:hypothetical protein
MHVRVRQAFLGLLTLAMLEACSRGPSELSAELREPDADLDAVLDVVRRQPRLLFGPDAEPVVRRLGRELRRNLRTTAASSADDGTPPSEDAEQAAQRAGKIVGLFERIFRCADRDQQLTRPQVNDAATAMLEAAEATGAVPALPEGTDLPQWARQQLHSHQLAVPVVQLTGVVPPALISHFQSNRNRFVADTCW